jgi:DNA-binding NtrC family response regulator
MPRLVLVLGGDRYVSFAIGDRAVIGRSSECEVQVVDATVSRRHALVRQDGAGYVVEDLGAGAGTRVDGAAVTGPVALAPGAAVQVGQVTFVFEPPIDAAGDVDGERTVAFIDDPAPLSFTLQPGGPAPIVPIAAYLAGLELVAAGDRGAIAALVGRVATRTGAERVIVLEALADGRLRPIAIHGGERGVAVSRTVVRRALADRLAFAVGDAVAEVTFARATSVFDLGVRAVMAAPLVRGERALGVVLADHRRQGAFTPAALAELTAAAAAIAIVVERTPAAGAAPAGAPPPAWIGADRATLDVLAQADRAAAAGSRVLVTGESGTGKELVARRIHAGSARAAGPWVALNCAALGEGVLDSELFGHEKGAFTGAARRKRGCFELADGGTLFLDEVGELSASTQAKLLRAIQDGRFFRVGGEQPIDVDVRVVAATHRDLRAMVRSGAFREDLYYRLAVIPLDVPPLRKRGDDVAILTEHFLAQLAAELGRPAPRLTPAAWQRWRAYAWPGNVRELRNAVERLVVLWGGEEVDVDELPQELAAGGPRAAGTLGAAVVAVEREAIAAALLASGGNKSAAARALGISRPTLDKKIKEHGLAGGDA